MTDKSENELKVSVHENFVFLSITPAFVKPHPFMEATIV